MGYFGPDRPHRITVRFSDDEKAKLVELAAQLKYDEGYWVRQARVSDVVRMAVEEFVASRLTPKLEPPKKPRRRRAAGVGA